MTTRDQKRAVEVFVAYWQAQRGSEKGEDQTFWNSLLGEVLGVSDVKSRIKYQEPVYYNDGSTKFLDAWIPETQVLIEHKSRGINLDSPQSGHHGQTPFEQAWDYDNNRPRRERARWIVVSNFDEIRVHDMEADRPAITYQTIFLKDLAKDVCRLSFLVTEVESIRDKEARVSVEAGRVVGNNFPWPGGGLIEAALPVRDVGGEPVRDVGGEPSRDVGGEPSRDVGGEPARNVSGASDESEFKTQIEKTAQAILDARALYPDSSLADLYDPLTMPPELRKAHQANDAAVMKAYGFPPGLTEPEIVSKLFEMYAKLTEATS